MNFDGAYQYVKSLRPIINPNEGFIRQLRQYENILKGTRTYNEQAGCIIS
jgi:hypothetical protein